VDAPVTWMRLLHGCGWPGWQATLVGVEDAVRLRVAFPCQYEGCPRTAATVEVTRRGQLYIDEEQEIIYRIFPDAQGTIRINGFLPYTGFSTHVTDLVTTADAVRAADAAALFVVDRTWVPFYCHHCDRSFCGQHWNLKATFNWGFDHYSGTCPVGHPHFINHC
jgi:hypothetical protein